jgi:hypothetical protein
VVPRPARHHSCDHAGKLAANQAVVSLATTLNRVKDSS